MVADKSKQLTRPKTAGTGAQPQAPAPADATKRKSWIKKSPVESSGAGKKQEEKVAGNEKRAAKEEGELQKMPQRPPNIGGV